MAKIRTTHDDADNDPTVHIATMVRIEVYTDEGTSENTPAEDPRPHVTLSLPADHVTLNRTSVFIRRPGVPASTYPLASIRAIHIDIRPLPADYHELRERYPHAYEPWEEGEAGSLIHWRHSGEGAGQMSAHFGRPPEHVVYKLAEFDVQGTEPPPPLRQPAPHHRVRVESRIEDHYIVSVRKGTDLLDVASRHGVDPTGIMSPFRMFCAILTEEQVESLRYDPDILHLQDDMIAKVE